MPLFPAQSESNCLLGRAKAVMFSIPVMPLCGVYVLFLQYRGNWISKLKIMMLFVVFSDPGLCRPCLYWTLHHRDHS